MTHAFTRSLSAITMLSMLVLGTGRVLAQDAITTMQGQEAGIATDNGTEQISLVVGEILEILPAHSLQNPAYSWILTQDRTFLQAARTATFRYRFIQPGTYSLITEIKSGDGQRSLQRTFVITAKARTPGNVAISTTPAPSASGSNLTGLVKIDPPMDTNERVILKNGQQLLKLTPLHADLKPLSLDLDINQDADNDGNPGNDVQNQGTFFQLYTEPLSIWFAEPLTSRTLAVVTVGTDGAARVQRIETVTASYAQEQNILVSPIRITSTPGENGSVSFSAVAGSTTPQSTSLLYHWTFGDGQESLILNPEHIYAADGVYTVSLQVKNLIDGQDVATDQQQVTIQGAGTAPSSAASSVSPSSSSFLSKLPIMSILIGLGIFVLFVLFGLGAVFLLSKLRGGKSLDQTFADMEKTLASKEESTKNPPVLVIPATATQTPKPAASPAPTKEDISRREENAASSPAPAATPRIDEKAAPDWLKKGLDTAPKPAPAAPTPTPMKTPVTTPTPVAAPAPTPTPAAPASTPPWLQTPPTVVAKPDAPSVPVTPKPTPVSPPAPTPAPVRVPPKPPVVTQPTTPPAVPPAPAPMPKPVAAPAPVTAPVTPPTPPVTSVAPKPTPVPVPAPQSVPTPVTPKPSAAFTPPVITPKPVTPVTPVAPIVPSTPKPAPVQTPAPQQTPAPVTSPKPPVPVSAPAPKPVVQNAVAPKPVTPPKPVSPVQTPIQSQTVPESKPTVPPAAPVPPPQHSPQNSADTPIAFIRAESLDKPQSGQS